MTRTATRLGVVATLVNVVGLALAGYLTVEHFSATPSYFCPANSVIDCARVTESSWSRFLGIPVAPMGLVYFAVSIPLQLPAAWRAASPWWVRARWAWAGVGMAGVIWLIYGELDVGAICLYCTGVHAATFVLFVITVIGSAIVTPGGTVVADEDVEA